MYKHVSIILVFAVFATLITDAIPSTAVAGTRSPVRPKIVYEGNNLFVGSKTANDVLSQNGTGYWPGIAGRVVTTCTPILFWDKVNFIEVYDRSSDPSKGATATFVIGKDGELPKIVWKSKVGQSIAYEFFTWREKTQ